MRSRLLLTFLCLVGPASAQVEQDPPNADFEPAFENQTRAPEIAPAETLRTEVFARGLEHPWGLAVLPDGAGYLVTERPGRLNWIAPDGSVQVISGTPEVMALRQAGMLDVALADDFKASRRIFLTYSRPRLFGRSSTAVGTGILNEDFSEVSRFREIFLQETRSVNPGHYGSRVVVDGDTLFVTIGDRRQPDEAQDLGGTLGKIIRITHAGDALEDNPFADRRGAKDTIWSYGHRNPQGAVLHPETGELWTLEHGPAGGDELNRIEKGANYGWPLVSYGINYEGTPVGTGQASANGVQEPVYYWDPGIAPSGFAFYTGDAFPDWQGDVLAGSLNPGGLVRLKLDGSRVIGEARYLDDLGRVRDVEIDTDGSVLLLTDDPDGNVVRITSAEG